MKLNFMKTQTILLAIVFLLFGYHLFAQDSENEYPATSNEWL